MRVFKYIVCFILTFVLGCTFKQNGITEKPSKNILYGKAALLTTRFNSFEELKKVIKIEYSSSDVPQVSLTHSSNGYEVNSIIRSGINELDIINAKEGDIWDQLLLAFNSPYVVFNRKDIMRVYLMARIRCNLFGEGDVAFYNISEAMMHNIKDDDRAGINPKDFGEKGFINTFNHITAQAIMTSIFSERLADFISDVHELRKLPEITTGNFTKEQIKDLEEGPVDNYIDIINNEWGQELGKALRIKYNISRHTDWTPDLLARYLNDIQSYYSWVFQIGFEPFRASDEIVIRFSRKTNTVLKGVSGMGFIDLICDFF